MVYEENLTRQKTGSSRSMDPSVPKSVASPLHGAVDGGRPTGALSSRDLRAVQRFAEMKSSGLLEPQYLTASQSAAPRTRMWGTSDGGSYLGDEVGNPVTLVNPDGTPTAAGAAMGIEALQPIPVQQMGSMAGAPPSSVAVRPQSAQSAPTFAAAQRGAIDGGNTSSPTAELPWDYYEDPITWLNRRAAEMYRREEV